MNVDALAAEFVVACADDELVLGRRDIEWTGFAPTIEEDLAFSSISQDEIGHALALYGVAAPLLGTTANALAFGRPPDAFRHARLLEAPSQDFAFTIARRFVYELFDRLRLEMLVHSSWKPLAALAGQMQREEVLHFDHAWMWMQRLATRAPGRQRLREALARVLPLSATLFEAKPHTLELIQAEVLPASFGESIGPWATEVSSRLESLGFAELIASSPTRAPSSRDAEVSADYLALQAHCTEVYRLAPGGRW